MLIKVPKKALTIPPLVDPEELNYESAQVIAYSYTDEDYDDCDNILPISIEQATPRKPIKIQIKTPEWVVPIISHRAKFVQGSEYILTPSSENEKLTVYFVSRIQKRGIGEVVIQVADQEFKLKARTCGV